MEAYEYGEGCRSKLGEGTYGTVFKAIEKETGRTVAIKKAKLEATDEEGVPTTVLREVALLRVAGTAGQNVVKLEKVCCEPDPAGKPAVFLVFEFMDCDLKRYIDRMVKRVALTDDVIKHVIREVLRGIDSLHKLGIMHRDLKPQNILVCMDIPDKPIIKIADLGLARNPTVPMMHKYTHEIMTLWYRAPEVLLGSDYSLPVDIWSVACIFAELFEKRPLFAGECEWVQLLLMFKKLGTPNDDVWPGVTKTPYWHECPQWRCREVADCLPWTNNDKDALDLLLKMLEYDPARRITMYILPSLAHVGKRRTQPPLFHEEIMTDVAPGAVLQQMLLTF